MTQHLSVDTAALERFQLRSQQLAGHLDQLQRRLRTTEAAAVAVRSASLPAPSLSSSWSPAGLLSIVARSVSVVDSVLGAFSNGGDELAGSLLDGALDGMIDAAWLTAETADRLGPIQADVTALVFGPTLGPTAAGFVGDGVVNARAQVWNRGVAPFLVDALAVAADPHAEPADNGDPGGRLTDRLTDPFEVAGRTPASQGQAAIISGLDDTVDKDRIRDDEFQLIEHGNDRFTVVLPGVIDLSRPDPGLHDLHASARDLQVAARSAASTDTADNLYAQMVSEYLVRELPEGAAVAIIGHSFGADTALDLVADPEINGGHVEVTHVVAAAYHSSPQLAALSAGSTPTDPRIGTEVLVLQNSRDLAVLVENLGHQSTIERGSSNADGLGVPDPLVRRFDGGWEGLGHHPSNYTAFLEGAQRDDELHAFFAGWAETGYAEPGLRRSVDISATV
jgi:hypothetical protein